MSDDNIGQLRSDVNSLQRELTRHDNTLDKLTEVNAAVAKLLAVQGTRLDQQETFVRNLDVRSDRREESLRELDRTIEKSKNEIIERVEDLLKDAKEDSVRDIARIENDLKSAENRISALEKRIWLFTGGLLLVSWGLREGITFIIAHWH